MKKLLIILLLSFIVNISAKGQSDLQKEPKHPFFIPNYKWDYDKLLPDTAEFIFQKGRLADSIKKIIYSSKEDVHRVWKYFLLAEKNLFINTDSIIFYAQKGAQLAKKIGYEPGEYYCNRVVAWGYSHKGIYTRALSIHFSLLKHAQSSNNDYRQAWELQSIGGNYLYVGDAPASLLYYRRALEKILPYAKMYPGSTEDILNNATEAYIALGRIDTALFLLEKAAEIDSQIRRYWAAPILLMAEIYAKKDQYQTALDLNKKAFYCGKYLFPVPSDTLRALNGIAEAFKKRGQYDSALYYAKSALASEASFIDIRLHTYAILTDLYAAKHNIDSAFKYQQFQLTVRDEILGKEKIKQIQNFAFSQQLEQQELAAAQAQYRNKIRTYILLTALAVFLAIAFILWRNNISRQKAYKELKATQIQLIEAEKMASLGKLQQAMLNERLRISRELHDDIGSTLSGIVLYSHMMESQVHTQRPGEVENSVNKIQQSAHSMVTRLNDLVWAVNPEQNSLKNLVQKLEDYAIEMAMVKSIRVQLNVPGNLAELQLPAESMHNIYLVCKEAINNAVKYSQASLLEISLHQFDHTIKFSIMDNGKGFDMATVKKGNGLRNMRKRADEAMATLSVQSTPHEGTVISLECKFI